jgi:mRNA interferase HicA
MTASELKHWLRGQGCTVVEGKSNTKAIRGALTARLPLHPSQEIKTGTLNCVLKDLGLKKE